MQVKKCCKQTQRGGNCNVSSFSQHCPDIMPLSSSPFVQFFADKPSLHLKWWVILFSLFWYIIPIREKIPGTASPLSAANEKLLSPIHPIAVVKEKVTFIFKAFLNAKLDKNRQGYIHEALCFITLDTLLFPE